ncbi:hypothetical protein V496_06404 [Pseudogymnoascus sp. VKM F-4515 (FW-2607)]|nr:hypothetical protein V496_06404 [Pseudogymnoascus sp. VKM F-4515 (FW-2607)]
MLVVVVVMLGASIRSTTYSSSLPSESIHSPHRHSHSLSSLIALLQVFPFPTSNAPPTQTEESRRFGSGKHPTICHTYLPDSRDHLTVSP